MRKSFLCFFVVAAILRVTDQTIIITHSMPKVFQLSSNKMAIVFDQSPESTQTHFDKLQNQENEQVQVQSSAQAQYQKQLEQAQAQQQAEAQARAQYEAQIQQQQQQIQRQQTQQQQVQTQYVPQVQSQGSQSSGVPSGASIKIVNAEGQSVSHHAQAFNQEQSATLSNDGKSQTHKQVTQYASVAGRATGLKYTGVGVYGLPDNFHEIVNNPTPSYNLPTKQPQPQEEESTHKPVVKPTHLQDTTEQTEVPKPTDSYNGGKISSGTPTPQPNVEEEVSLPPTTSDGYNGGQISSGTPTDTTEETFDLPPPTSDGYNGGQISSGAPTMGIGLANPNAGTTTPPPSDTEQEAFALPPPTSEGYNGGQISSGTPMLYSQNPTVTSSQLQSEPEPEPVPADDDIESYHETINSSPMIGLASPGSQ